MYSKSKYRKRAKVISVGSPAASILNLKLEIILFKIAIKFGLSLFCLDYTLSYRLTKGNY